MGYLVRVIVFFLLNKTALEAFASSSGPRIDYCFTLTEQQATSGHCRWDNISDSALQFGNLERNTLQIPSGSNINFLILKCTAPHPVKWLARTPLGGVDLIPTYEGNRLNQHPRSVQPTSYTQRLLIELGKRFSRRFRCESFSHPESMAEVYVNPRKRGDNYWTIDKSTSPRAFVGKAKTGEHVTDILPFDALGFHGDYFRSLTFIRREVSDYSISEVSEGCMECLCKSSCETFPCDSSTFCGEIPQDYWKTYEPIENQDFSSCTSNASCALNITKSYLNTIERQYDCNANGVVSCEDYARVHMKGDWRQCEERLPNATEEILANNFTKCLVEEKTNFTILNYQPDDYDPRIGLRVVEGLDGRSEYECIYRDKTHHKHTMVMSAIQAHAELSYDSDIQRFQCKHTMTGLSHPDMVFARCGSLLECALKYEPIPPFIYNTMGSFSQDNELGVEVRLDRKLPNNGFANNFTHGFAQCNGLYGRIHDTVVVGEIDYFFTGLNNRKYLISERIPPDAVIQLSKSNQQSAGDNLGDVFHCKISTFVLLPNIQFLVEYNTGEEESFKPDVVSTTARVTDLLHDKERALQTTELVLKVSARMVKLTCYAPWINSEDWAYSEIFLSKTSTPVPDYNLNVFAIIGIAAAGTIILAVVIIVIVLQRKRSKSVVVTRNLTQEEVQEFHHGASNHAFSDKIIAPEDLAFIENLKISSSELSVGNVVLGEGQFGIVHKGDFGNQQVAVKSCKPSADVELFKSFLKELKVMAYVGEHPNIVRFFGAVVDNIEKGLGLAVIELSPYGNLNGYLRKHSRKLSKASEDGSGPERNDTSSRTETELNVVLNSSTLVSFCQQIANGMKYLAEKKVIHADLATRNVLVFQGNVVKITDFGLSRKLYNYNNYTKKTKTPLPWQWMALESLRMMEFSTQSDVWSFGVTVWEIFSLGQVPFFGSSWTTEFADQLEAGMRLLKPALAPQAVYGWIMSCWDNNPENRPTFAECERFFTCLAYEGSDGRP